MRCRRPGRPCTPRPWEPAPANGLGQRSRIRLSAPVEEARSLRGLAHALPGATVLAVRKGSEFIGEPPADIDLREGDELILYGRRGELGGTE